MTARKLLTPLSTHCNLIYAFQVHAESVTIGTCAGLGEKFYIQDSIRVGSIEEALLVENTIRKVWENHSNYYFIEAEMDIEEKN